MIKITAVSPHKEFEKLIKELFEKHKNRADKPEYEYEDYELEVIYSPGYIELENVRFNTDVIIGRGGIIYHLRTVENFIPFVEVPIAGHDLIHTLYECKLKYGSSRIAVAGPANMVSGAERLSKILGVEIKAFLMENEHHIEKTISNVISQGYDTVVGGVKTSAHASKIGLHSMFIQSGEESIWQAITEAKRVAYVSRREQEKAQQYNTIIDYAYEGIIALDTQNRITVFNSVAKNILGINGKNVIGSSVDAVIQNNKFRDLLSTDAKYLYELVKYNEVQLNVNKVPIIYKGKSVGSVLTFHDVTRIQEMEGQIRQKIYSRGHIAKHSFENIIGQSKKIKDAIQTAKKFSKVNSNVLIFGETGTGKELFAQSIHNYSPRRGGPFVAVNCAALPENLLESELFGYAEGAFTGAVKGGKPGLFELAHGGTIFLDEISEISMRLQSRLLRVLQEKEIMRLGHDRVIPVDVRIVSATNKDLNALVRKGEFREDLYYRLDVLKIIIPSLKERISDIPDIVESFTKSCLSKYGKENVEFTTVSMKRLQEYSWPGNVRQLENICERLVVLNENRTIDECDVLNVLPAAAEDGGKSGFVSEGAAGGRTFTDELKQLERNRIIDVLERTGNNKSKAARMLGINRTTLWRRMLELDV